MNTSTTFFQNHAAAIASFAASTAVFLGCEVAIGAATGGVGAVVGAAACGALAGEVGGAIDQGFKCMDGQSGACSAKAFGGAILLGAVGGAIGGALGGALGGKLAEAAIGKILPKLVTNTLEGAAVGGISGGATGAADYGLTCSASCSWSGAANAAISGAEDGAIGGAAGGMLFTGAAAVKGRSSKGADESGPVEEGAGGSCPIGGSAPHSFTGSTPVLMADGTAKPIDQVKAGDEIKNAVPGKDEPQTHKVDKVIVTTTDHDFVDLTIAPTTENTSSPSTSHQASKARTLHKAALGLAASVMAFATVLGTSPDSSASALVADVGDVTTHGSTLTTTYHHPFYDQTQSSFVDAQDLHPGDVLQTATGSAQVTSVRLYHANATTYDLTINSLHTYYVVAGGVPILVHNINTGCPTSYALSLKTGAPKGSGANQAYQIRVVGSTEYHATGGGTQVWADGLDINTSQLLDAKHVGNAGRSPFVPGGKVPDFIQAKIDLKVDDEFSRYSAVINDPGNPLVGLHVITNESGAVPYFTDRMQQHGIPGSVSVVP
ncbi:restriction endonuclease fold toxin-2 domain-containing protein [Streptomyces sp. G-G2]|uniref:restriction endonuclease fold toxin-2 domain-containing protein n=1 Tax=Streptomyces sp. G-G2 TaxID=3046201 RepID=UPI0024B8B9D9|nr:restriction endonuclease fold toxin-2 domain-containing protein [Streptomyces sp. G-G2]MDJ0383206.1 polymorphic toxin-type HINT domain-containing protein [Streptomyces sp. G-G2]